MRQSIKVFRSYCGATASVYSGTEVEAHTTREVLIHYVNCTTIGGALGAGIVVASSTLLDSIRLSKSSFAQFGDPAYSFLSGLYGGWATEFSASAVAFKIKNTGTRLTFDNPLRIRPTQRFHVLNLAANNILDVQIAFEERSGLGYVGS